MWGLTSGRLSQGGVFLLAPGDKIQYKAIDENGHMKVDTDAIMAQASAARARCRCHLGTAFEHVYRGGAGVVVRKDSGLGVQGFRGSGVIRVEG